jgi:spore maturation protein CgeB
MKIVVFGLTVSSSWGNGHATLWRGLCGALGRLGHHVTFFERDAPYYAAARDLTQISPHALRIYPTWESVRDEARRVLDGADAALVTSYCPDAVAATELVLESGAGVRAFYDLDTPITLARLRAGRPVDYLGPQGLSRFDVVLSFTGGSALAELTERLGARRVIALHGSVDPEVYYPAPPRALFRSDLSYLGTYSADRQAALFALFLEPIRRSPTRRFVLGGSLYPHDFPWLGNLNHVGHVAPQDHSAFYGSSALTLNITRGPMAEMGHCPSGRLFEAAASGVAVLSDAWEGIERFFTPGREILLARTTEDVLAAIALPREELAAIGRAARDRALREHTADHRASELIDVLWTSQGGR